MTSVMFAPIRRLLIEKKNNWLFIRNVNDFKNLLQDLELVMKVDNFFFQKREENYYNATVFSDLCCYSISYRAFDKNKKDCKGYIGCIMSNRYPRLGEEWTRGADLPDGKATLLTWERILLRIFDIEQKKTNSPKPIKRIRVLLHFFLNLRRKIKDFFFWKVLILFH